ncbi:MAG: hypothetical protein RQ754_13235 [Desulfuromonadales bacterium]|nr:hypothetical protein [Desulfuromonadales bacterium]
MSLDTLIAGFKVWRNIQVENSERLLKKQAAIGCVKDAVLATKAYLYDRDNDGINRETERLLSERWQKTASAIREYDFELYISSEIKALGWADPKEWTRAVGRELPIKLDTILEQCRFLEENIGKDQYRYKDQWIRNRHKS